MLFPRWTGPDGNPRVLLGRASLIEYVRSYNGRKPVWISVYAFDRFRNRKPVVQSAYIDCLYIRGQPEDCIDYIKQLRDLDLSHRAVYDGSGIDIILPLGKVYSDIWSVIHDAKGVVDLPYSSRTWDLHLWYRTWNPKTKRYVIDVDELDISKLDDLSKKPIKGKRRGGKFIDQS